MNSSKRLLGVFAIFGLAAGIAYWFYLYMRDPENAPTVADFYGMAKSYVSRGWLIVKGTVDSNDPKAIAGKLIAELEGFSPHAYADPPNQGVTYSIGYGHQIIPGDGLSLSSHLAESDALSLLIDSDLPRFADCVDGAVKVALSPDQKAALYSLCYNIGCGNFRSSTLLRLVNAGSLGAAALQFAVWNRAGGQVNSSLVARRAKEAALFIGSNPQEDQIA